MFNPDQSLFDVVIDTYIDLERENKTDKREKLKPERFQVITNKKNHTQEEAKLKIAKNEIIEKT